MKCTLCFCFVLFSLALATDSTAGKLEADPKSLTAIVPADNQQALARDKRLIGLGLAKVGIGAIGLGAVGLGAFGAAKFGLGVIAAKRLYYGGGYGAYGGYGGYGYGGYGGYGYGYPVKYYHYHSYPRHYGGYYGGGYGGYGWY